MKYKILITLLSLSIILSITFKAFSVVDKNENKNQEIFDSLVNISNKKKVLLIELSSVISYSSSIPFGVENLVRIINKATKNPEVAGLMIRANSPGGTIVASQELYEAIKRFRESGKPIITSIMDMCASGCYYAVLPSSTIIANSGSIVGSIGVKIVGVNLVELYKKIGISFNTITSGEYKDILSSSRKMKVEEKNHLTKIILEFHRQFVEVLVKWRKDKSSTKKLTALANGLIYSATDSLDKGLVDKIGDNDFAKNEMAKALDTTVDELYFYNPKPIDFLKNILELNSLAKLMSIFRENLFENSFRKSGFYY